jgi:hypothetical protein
LQVYPISSNTKVAILYENVRVFLKRFDLRISFFSV